MGGSVYDVALWTFPAGVIGDHLYFVATSWAKSHRTGGAFAVWEDESFATFHPTGLFALYVAGYSAFRILEESLRVDPAHHMLGPRLNFYVACALTIAGLLWFIASRRRDRSKASPRGRRRSAALLAIGWATSLWSVAGRARKRPRRHTAPSPRST